MRELDGEEKKNMLYYFINNQTNCKLKIGAVFWTVRTLRESISLRRVRAATKTVIRKGKSRPINFHFLPFPFLLKFISFPPFSTSRLSELFACRQDSLDGVRVTSRSQFSKIFTNLTTIRCMPGWARRRKVTNDKHIKYFCRGVIYDCGKSTRPYPRGFG